MSVDMQLAPKTKRSAGDLKASGVAGINARHHCRRYNSGYRCSDRESYFAAVRQSFQQFVSVFSIPLG